MNILIFEKGELVSSNLLQISGRRADHLLKVIKVEPGKIIKVGELNGNLGLAEVLRITESQIELKIIELSENASLPWIDVLLAMPRPQMCKRIFQNLSGLGVGRLDLINSVRVEKSYFSSPVLHKMELEKYLTLGLEQSRFTHLCKVNIWKNQGSFYKELSLRAETEYDELILAEPDAKSGFFSKNMLKSPDTLSQPKILLAIGPEGGWVKSEIENFEKLGFESYNFGKQLMKVETALVYILAQIKLICEKNQEPCCKNLNEN